jgi:hypothetical protein
LAPNQTKNIWLLNSTYSTAFPISIVEVDLGAFPPDSNGPTQTPSPTPTPTPNSVPFILGYSTIPNQACTTTETSYYGTQSGGLTIEVGEFLYSDTSTLTPAINGYYSDGLALYIVSGGLGEVTFKDSNGCLSLVTPTPSVTQTNTPSVTPSYTPTNTPTPSNTPAPTRYSFSDICHDEFSADDACSCTGFASIWGNNIEFSASTLFWANPSGVNTGNPVGFYAVDNVIYYVNDDCGIGCSTGSTLGYSQLCSVTPTPTNTPTLTQTPTNTQTQTSTPTNTPTNTQSGTPIVTPTNTASVTPTLTQTPTPSSFGSNTFKVTMSNSSRALINEYTLTEVPYISTSGIGFSATTGTFPLSATSSSSSSVYGTHAALNSSTVSFEINSTGSASISILWFVNGSVVSTLNSSVVSGPNTLNLFVAGPYSTSDTIEFRIS